MPAMGMMTVSEKESESSEKYCCHPRASGRPARQWSPFSPFTSVKHGRQVAFDDPDEEILYGFLDHRECQTWSIIRESPDRRG